MTTTTPKTNSLTMVSSPKLLRMYQYQSSLLLILLISILLFTESKNTERDTETTTTTTPEALFRSTVVRWRSQNNWAPWVEYANVLHDRFQTSHNDKNVKIRREVVEGYEEGILAIERHLAERGERTDRERDAALSRLYEGYGYVLSKLNGEECLALASDPRTLLIGADDLVQAIKKKKKKEEGEDHNQLEEEVLCRPCTVTAENALRNAATLDATNTSAEKILQELLNQDDNSKSTLVHERKPTEFVAELFDAFADTFDQKLLVDLEYRVPTLVGDAAQRMMGVVGGGTEERRYGNALDAGCGTGLAGRVVRSLVKEMLVGVDASRKMLDIAEKCTLSSGCGLKDGVGSGNDGDGNDDTPLYDSLLVMDLEDMTISNTLTSDTDSDTGFDLVIAADVLVYFGNITNLLTTFANLSNTNAVLIFSCERATDEEAPLGWRLLPSGRFAHTKSHALEAAKVAGYELYLYEEIVPRMEKGEEVKGHLFGFVLRSSSSSGDDEF